MLKVYKSQIVRRLAGTGKKQNSTENTDLSESDLMNQLVIVADRLRAEDVIEVAEGRKLAIRIPHYIQPLVAALASGKIIKNSELGSYENANIDYFGIPFYDTNDNFQYREKYWNKNIDISRNIRSLFGNYLSPVDKLRLELDDLWEAGCSLLNLGGRKMSPAIVRVFNTGGDALPHQDNLSWDIPFAPDAKSLMCQLTALNYLEMPQSGGEVELWDLRLSKDEYDERRLIEKDTDKFSYGLNRKTIPKPDLVFKPVVGDLWVFNASKVHAVRPVKIGKRITVSSFIGFNGRAKQLFQWQ